MAGRETAETSAQARQSSAATMAARAARANGARLASAADVSGGGGSVVAGTTAGCCSGAGAGVAGKTAAAARAGEGAEAGATIHSTAGAGAGDAVSEGTVPAAAPGSATGRNSMLGSDISASQTAVENKEGVSLRGQQAVRRAACQGCLPSSLSKRPRGPARAAPQQQRRCCLAPSHRPALLLASVHSRLLAGAGAGAEAGAARLQRQLHLGVLRQRRDARRAARRGAHAALALPLAGALRAAGCTGASGGEEHVSQRRRQGRCMASPSSKERSQRASAPGAASAHLRSRGGSARPGCPGSWRSWRQASWERGSRRRRRRTRARPSHRRKP